MNNNQKELLNKLIERAHDLFQDELSTDENMDYRRGFLAGRLFASLQIKDILEGVKNDD